jgi:hypothetical protein
MEEVKKILVVDINYLLDEHVNSAPDVIKEKLEKEYNCKVIFIDSSRINKTNNNSNNPIYFA